MTSDSHHHEVTNMVLFHVIRQSFSCTSIGSFHIICGPLITFLEYENDCTMVSFETWRQWEEFRNPSPKSFGAISLAISAHISKLRLQAVELRRTQGKGIFLYCHSTSDQKMLITSTTSERFVKSMPRTFLRVNVLPKGCLC